MTQEHTCMPAAIGCIVHCFSTTGIKTDFLLTVKVQMWQVKHWMPLSHTPNHNLMLLLVAFPGAICCASSVDWRGSCLPHMGQHGRRDGPSVPAGSPSECQGVLSCRKLADCHDVLCPGGKLSFCQMGLAQCNDLTPIMCNQAPVSASGDTAQCLLKPGVMKLSICSCIM
jgi:hypothetical protein